MAQQEQHQQPRRWRCFPIKLLCIVALSLVSCTTLIRNFRNVTIGGKSAVFAVVFDANKHDNKNNNVKSTNDYDAIPQLTNQTGIRIRPYDLWPADQPLPCYAPETNMLNSARRNLPKTDRGFLFVKTYKTGSSSASGINLRIARNVAARRRRRQAGDFRYDICKARFHHATARQMLLPAGKRRSNSNDTNPTKATKKKPYFLWSIVREPTSRILSWYFFFRIMEKEKRELASTEHFINDIRMSGSKFMVHNHYLRYLSLNANNKDEDGDPAIIVNDALDQMDFIAVTERMDESMVVLAMLLDIPIADVLFLSAKVHHKGGGRDSNKHYVFHQNQCREEIPRFVTEGMQRYLDSDEWYNISYWDRVLYDAANHKLDATIDHRLGRARFESNLASYRKAQRIAQERCSPVTRFPCSFSDRNNMNDGERSVITSDGSVRRTPNKVTDCLWGDSACGMDCLDEVSTEFGLWSPLRSAFPA